MVTGAGTGIGRATARRFAAKGARVVAVGRRHDPLAETASGHDRIQPLVADVTADADELVGTVLESYGRLDVLVNNAGIVRSGTLETITPEAVDAQLATNLVAPIMLTRAALPALTAAKGVVVNVSTPIGQRGWPGNSVYAATKAALETLTRSWAVELAPHGIRVVAVAPGATATPISLHQGLPAERIAAIREWQLAATPMRRLGQPEEIAWAITLLASPQASFVTGTVFAVDGGAAVQ
ncbi:SDR family oxidoreductase [Plantactinospora sp. B24E8]|uniref:SDR family NAD(P)-dependent oxidoreductase n=1 Tax=Plantactinospora sp. B24E8 TaxID=3153567 RepID=UPI00325D9586